MSRIRSSFLNKIETFLRDYPEVTPTRLGVEATGDPGLVFGLRKGRQPRLDTVERIGRAIINLKQRVQELRQQRAASSAPAPSSADARRRRTQCELASPPAR